jgi:hypothetical protein
LSCITVGDVGTIIFGSASSGGHSAGPAEHQILLKRSGQSPTFL